jgi:hypothetical protein
MDNTKIVLGVMAPETWQITLLLNMVAYIRQQCEVWGVDSNTHHLESF